MDDTITLVTPPALSEDQVRGIIREYEVRRPHHRETERNDIIGLLATLESVVRSSTEARVLFHEQEQSLIDYFDATKNMVAALCQEIEKLPASEQRAVVVAAASAIELKLGQTASRLRDRHQNDPMADADTIAFIGSPPVRPTPEQLGDL